VKVVQPAAFGSREIVEGEVGERRAAPEAERLSEGFGRPLGLVRFKQREPLVQ
jgi:hypothetical protein